MTRSGFIDERVRPTDRSIDSSTSTPCVGGWARSQPRASFPSFLSGFPTQKPCWAGTFVVADPDIRARRRLPLDAWRHFREILQDSVSPRSDRVVFVCASTACPLDTRWSKKMTRRRKADSGSTRSSRACSSRHRHRFALCRPFDADVRREDRSCGRVRPYFTVTPPGICSQQCERRGTLVSPRTGTPSNHQLEQAVAYAPGNVDGLRPPVDDEPGLRRTSSANAAQAARKSAHPSTNVTDPDQSQRGQGAQRRRSVRHTAGSGCARRRRSPSDSHPGSGPPR